MTANDEPHRSTCLSCGTIVIPIWDWDKDEWFCPNCMDTLCFKKEG